jgi:tetratricopeptide (TPR) repeat protein
MRFQEALQLLVSRQGSPANIDAALVKLAQARTLLPNHAGAYGATAEAYLLLAGYGRMAPRSACDQAQQFAQRALEIDAGRAYAHYAWGGTLLWCQLDLSGAERELKRAVALDPTLTAAQFWLADLYTFRGQDDALERTLAEIRAHDRSTLIQVRMVWYQIYRRQYVDAEATLTGLLSRDPKNRMARRFLGRVYLHQGRADAALAAFRAYAEPGPIEADLSLLGEYTIALARKGETDQARQQLAAIQARRTSGEVISSFRLAQIHAALGDSDDAIAELEQSYQEREPLVLWATVEPSLDSLRGRDRFRRLLHNILSS